MKPSSSEYIGHYVRAVYDFETQHPKEINLKKGDIIKVTKIIDGNWLHGINRNVEGNFPSSFVEKISMPVVTPGQMVFGAIENFPAQQDGDLEFRKGMVIEGTERIDDNWWRGKIGTQSGIFPTTHVIELEVPQALRDRAASVHSSEPMFAQALCDSAAQLDEELGFHAGDIVTVTEIIDDDWYYGELGDKKGIFLSSCVELMQDTYALAEHAEHNQSKESLQNTIDNSKLLTRQTAVDQPVSLSNPDKVQKIDIKGGNVADVNANISNQTESYSDFTSGLDESSEYNTQFSYTNENTRSLESSISPYGMTLFSFVGESPNELSFNENEIVYLIQHVDGQWIEGQIDDKIGIFPANFVSIVVDCPYAYDIDQDINETEEIESIAMGIENESSPQNSVTIGDGFSQRLKTEIELSPLEQYGLVLYDFTAEVDGDLSVFAGETLEIVNNVDSNWVQAKNDHGKIGMIPKQFLDIVDEPQNLPPCDTKIISSSDSDFSSKKCDSNICDKSEPKSVEIDAQLSKPKKNDVGPKKEPLPSEIYKIPTYTPCSKTGSFRKPSLPTKPKPSLAPKPILKPKPLSPKPVSVLKNKSGPSKTVNSATTITTTTAKDDQSLNKSSVERFVTENEAASQIPKSKSSTDVSILKNGTKNEENRISIDCSAAFGEIDSIVNTEMEKEIKKSSNIDFNESGENRIAEIKNKRTVSFSKPNHIENKKRHSVNFPLSNFRTMDCGMNKRSNRQSLAIPLKPQIEQKSTKVGYSTFFTDFSSEEISPVKAVPMRKPPPPPQKTESFDFTRKPSLRKPPPPRPSVPKDRPLSPPRPEEGPVPTQKSKKAEKTKKNQEKRPRPHITPTRPAPQRPVPGQPARRPPPKPPVSDNLMSFSPTKEEPDDTNFEIIEDLKQRIKEVETDLERYKKNKEELEIQHTEDGNSSEVHDNIEFYIANIEGLTNELDSLKENLHKVLPSSELDEVARKMAEEEKKKEEEQRKEEDRKKAEEQKIKRREKREKVIDELIQTERDFLHGLHLCIETFVSPTADKCPDVDVEAVFGNIEDVADVSQRLLTLLEDAVNGKDFEDQLLGSCFIKLSEDMKNAYAPYCRNHDEVISILEKYRDEPSIKQYFTGKLNELREQIVVFDLEALLIKPVQRILKYPLLLNELIKSTEDSHEDKLEVLNGINAMTDVAAAINEYKRRKDLVFKYKRETDQSLGDMLGKLTLHTLKKKGSRFKGRLSTNLGISPQTKDEDFDKEEIKFREMEKTVKIFTKDVQTYMDSLQESYSSHEGLVIDLVDFYDEKPCPDVTKYQRLFKIIQDKYLPEFTCTVAEIVVVPLSKLMVFFNGPNKVIQKRYDKLLDYDSMQRKEEKGSEKSLQAAKITYEALNAQLLDELPKMYSLSFKLLKDCISTFIRAQRQFNTSIMDSMTEIIDMPLLLQTEGTVVDSFNIHHVAMIDKMSLLRIIPKGFNPKMETLGKPVVGKATDKKSKRMSMDTSSLLPSPVPSTAQSDSQRVFVQQKYPADKLYHVTSTYTATDLMDLSVAEGDSVGLIMDKDPMGNKDRWFIDNGAAKGFVPKTLLKLHSQATTSSSQSLYPSMDQTPVLAADETSNVIDQKSELSSPHVSVSDYSIEQNLSNQNEEDDELDFALDEDMSPNISSEEFYYAAFPFEARNGNEISMFEGQVVTVLIKHDQENNIEWWYVDADGVKGYAPANYLQPMK
ncbi:dynamin-binding protein-like [Mytilus trossulus]|uniref:dynamin-binding protein-like n=1 Tax=Mytilus trossulus TaxID=6551 RepID=UPI003003A978